MNKMLKMSKAFSDQNRVKILTMLSDGPLSVGSVADNLDVEQNLASHHLRVLHSLGLLKSTKKGREVFYNLHKPRFLMLFKDLGTNSFFREILTEALDEAEKTQE